MSESKLELSVAGRTYEVPQPPARIGLALQAAWTVANARRAGKPAPPYAIERMGRYDSGESEIEQDALGPVWDQMIDDEVGIHDLRRAGLAAYVWICTGKAESAHKILAPDTEGTDSGPKA